MSLKDAAPSVHVSLAHALAGGGVGALVAGAVAIAVGQVSAAEAEVLLQATQPTTRFLCSSIMTASATILALMLTVIGLSRNIDHPIRPAFYRRLQQVALLDVITFAAASVLLLTLVVPFGEDLDFPSRYYVTIYYVVTGASVLIGGLLISVVLMLYGAVRDIMMLFWGDESPVLDEEAEARQAGAQEDAGS